MFSHIRRIPFSIWILSIGVLLMTCSSGLIFTFTPLYIKKYLKASMTTIGTLEGAIESIANISRIGSGILSDIFKKRTFLVIIGYGLSAVAKILIPFFMFSFGWLYSIRSIERIGNGIQAAPRDALIGDLAREDCVGECYGLKQACAKFGTAIGCLAVSILAFSMTSTELSPEQYRLIFIFGSIPSIIGVIIIFIFVKDPDHCKLKSPISVSLCLDLGKDFWKLMIVVVIYYMAHASEAFLSFRADEIGIRESFIPILILIMNSVLAFFSIPVGRIIDNIVASKMLMYGLCVYILSNIILSFFVNIYGLLAGIVLWGIHLCMVQVSFSCMISKFVSEEKRGSAFGMFFLISGLCMIPAGRIWGFLWEDYGSSLAFAYGAIFSLMATIVLRNIKFNSL
jgi:MFS family permease